MSVHLATWRMRHALIAAATLLAVCGSSLAASADTGASAPPQPPAATPQQGSGPTAGQQGSATPQGTSPEIRVAPPSGGGCTFRPGPLELIT